MLSCFAALVTAAVLAGSPATASDLAPGVRIEAGGKAIDVEVGHAAPHYVDFDGDGTKDLLVGQFGGGKLRIYKNVGSNENPRFNGFTFLKAGGKIASVPAG